MTARLLSGSKLGSELCKVFGLDGSCITGLTLRAVAGKVATLQVEMAVDESQADGIAAAVREYELVPVGDRDSEAA